MVGCRTEPGDSPPGLPHGFDVNRCGIESVSDGMGGENSACWAARVGGDGCAEGVVGGVQVSA